ncbi:MAG: MOSC domain-containing protein [Phycisphaerales bacterium]|nr:MOSC domain-containing protein [Phycisphaerales bacterium]
MKAQSGIIRGIASRPGDHEPIVEHESHRVIAGLGLEHDPRAKGKRGITLLSAERWADTLRDLGRTLPWHARRANVLVEGVDLATTIGRRLRLGEIEVHVWGETKPCGEMDEACPGLKDALKPDMRGGVHAEVVTGGTIRVGDPIAAIASNPPAGGNG